MRKEFKRRKGITLIGLIVTIIILLLLAGITIAILGGENGIFEKVKLAKKSQLESEMKEKLTIGLQELQIEKKANATLDDVTQDWANSTISSDYNPIIKEDESLNEKLIVMTKDNIIGKFLVDQNLNIIKTEYNVSSVELEYTITSRIDNRVKINIVATDRINGIKQIDYPEGNPLKVVDGKKEQISIDYDVELGKEYKFVITTGDGNKTEKIIKIDARYLYKDGVESIEVTENANWSATSEKRSNGIYLNCYDPAVNYTCASWFATETFDATNYKNVTVQFEELTSNTNGFFYFLDIWDSDGNKLDIKTYPSEINGENKKSITIDLSSINQDIWVRGGICSAPYEYVVKENWKAADPYTGTVTGLLTFVYLDI